MRAFSQGNEAGMFVKLSEARKNADDMLKVELMPWNIWNALPEMDIGY
jgi:hypothetical protein